ncbi:uncharacterized protein LOC119332694 [Triticum dicoccoides]|uniref:uncharacterized protein LOC119332694 n=1 Tax=Triticum dicoccoides TaxID=85692 RepID=UPI0018910428|nr:uncharacterized protein LOC119332694 [Triticum dicoccoides]
MEPATKQDLKDLLKEFRESMKESIREAVAVGFGNTKPAFEQATISTSSQFLAMDASDDKDLAPACSSPEQGTYALDFAPTTTIDALPELDIDATGVAAPTPTTCSTDGLIHSTDGDDRMEASKAAWDSSTPFTARPGDSPTPMSEPSLGLALGALAQTKCLAECSGQVDASVTASVILATAGCMPTTCSTEWVTHADSRIIDSSSTTLPIWLAAAAVHRSWVQTVPPHPPDLRLFFWWDHGCLMSGRGDLERVIHPSPNESLCTRQCQEVKLSCLFHGMSISWQWLVHWLVYGVDLHQIPCPSFSNGEPPDVDCSSVANWDPHVPISVDDKFLKHLFLSVQVHDSGMVVVPSLTLIRLLTVLEAPFTIHGGFLLIDGLWGWSLHLFGRVKKVSDDKRDAQCSLVYLKLQQHGLFVVHLTDGNSLCSCHYTDALAFEWGYNHISYRQLLEICCKRLKCKWRIQSGLVQTTFSRIGAVTSGTMGLLVVQLPECIDDQLAELLKENFNEMPKCSVTPISCESGCKLHNTSFFIWRTSAVCLLLCCYDQFQWKLAGLCYHLSNCCPVTLLGLPVSANCLTRRYAGHKNQVYHMKLSHSNHCQEGINLQVEQIWCAITSNTIDAYPCGGEDHARESLFNLELAVHAKEFDVHGGALTV